MNQRIPVLKKIKSICNRQLRRMGSSAQTLWKRFRMLDRNRQIALVCAALLIIILLVRLMPKSVRIATVPSSRGEFIIDLNVRGEIDALNSTTVSVPGMRRRMLLQIVAMAPEGIVVRKGDFLFQLDQSEALQKVDSEMDNLANARAELESERANIASTMAQLESDLE